MISIIVPLVFFAFPAHAASVNVGSDFVVTLADPAGAVNAGSTSLAACRQSREC